MLEKAHDCKWISTKISSGNILSNMVWSNSLPAKLNWPSAKMWQTLNQPTKIDKEQYPKITNQVILNAQNNAGVAIAEIYHYCPEGWSGETKSISSSTGEIWKNHGGRERNAFKKIIFQRKILFSALVSHFPIVEEYYCYFHFQKIRVGRARKTTNRLGVAS